MLVKDPEGQPYSDGKRYRTFYVPAGGLPQGDRRRNELGADVVVRAGPCSDALGGSLSAETRLYLACGRLPGVRLAQSRRSEVEHVLSPDSDAPLVACEAAMPLLGGRAKGGIELARFKPPLLRMIGPRTSLGPVP